jgi:tryptophan synthase alpha subunit
VGFGISTAEHVAAVGEFADAAVIGSAIVSLIEKTDPPHHHDHQHQHHFIRQHCLRC